MSLVVVLATPLVGAILLAVARGIAARVLHLLATVLTAAAAGAVAVQVSHAGSIVALGGLFRADGLSAWMIGLIALVSLLAAIEAPHTVPSAAVGRVRPPREPRALPRLPRGRLQVPAHLLGRRGDRLHRYRARVLRRHSPVRPRGPRATVDDAGPAGAGAAAARRGAGLRLSPRRVRHQGRTAP